MGATFVMDKEAVSIKVRDGTISELTTMVEPSGLISMSPAAGIGSVFVMVCFTESITKT